MNKGNLLRQAKRIHSRVTTIDSHIDIKLQNFTEEVNYTQALQTQVNLPKMIEGGLDVAWLIVFTGQRELNETRYQEAKEIAASKFDAIDRLCYEYAPDYFALADSSEGVQEGIAAGKKVVMIGVENGYPLGTDLSLLEEYHRRGARYLSLSHNGHNQLCDSNTGEADNIWIHGGLSGLGREAVAEMNRLGIMVDASHVSRDSMLQMVALSKCPIIASHSSARALCNHSRNLDDEQLMALKERGGLVQTVAFSSYLNTDKHNAREAFLREYKIQAAETLGLPYYDAAEFSKLDYEQIVAFMSSRFQIQRLADHLAAEVPNAPAPVDVNDFIDHLDYLVDKMGVDQVGISSDFDGGGGIEGWQDASETFNVTLELVKRGYTEAEIAQLWGGNLMRILDEIQAFAGP
jgi:membrane dipeptidase